jgi:ribosome-binding factor A
MADNRKAKLESLLLREIAVCVQQELRDPRLGFITITKVVMTDDLHEVKAYFTVLGDPQARNLASQALQAARPYVQRSYAKVVHTRLLPQLSFVYDDVEYKRTTMDDLIAKARATDTDQGAVPEPSAPDPRPGDSLLPPPRR